MKEIKEWGLVQELMEMLEEIEVDTQRQFVQDLFDNLDPFAPFLEQQSQKQLDYLYAIHDLHCNGNEDAFEEWND